MSQTGEKSRLWLRIKVDSGIGLPNAHGTEHLSESTLSRHKVRLKSTPAFGSLTSRYSLNTASESLDIFNHIRHILYMLADISQWEGI
jgi:hypothetical protein